MGGQPYQEQYVKNAEEIGELWQFTASPGVCFEDWYAKRLRDRARLAELKQENAALLSNCLYPAPSSQPKPSGSAGTPSPGTTICGQGRPPPCSPTPPAATTAAIPAGRRIPPDTSAWNLPIGR